NQEAYDNFVQAYRIAEHPEVRIQVMICQDAFITSHAVENIELMEDDAVRCFVGDYHPESYLLNPGEPMAVGPYATSPYYMEAKRVQLQGLKNAKAVIQSVAREFEAISGRPYDLFETYKMEDAQYALVIMGSAAGTAKDAVDALRKRGLKVGLIKIRVFRPFPGEEIAQALKGIKVVGCMDRTESYNGNCGPIAAEVTHALYQMKSDVAVVNYVYGLGGCDVTVESMTEVFDELVSISWETSDEPRYRYVSLRG
ncbi:MAG: pyruvate ferredoxin oxidoreductase, partial [Eubacterium aggregans]